MAAPKKASSARASASIPQVAWHQIRPAPIILVSGPEGFLAERASRQLRDALRDVDESLEVHDLMADSYAPGELMTLASPSLFGEPRLIRIDGASTMNDAFLQEALEYLETPADDTVLVIRHGGGVRGKKLLDAIRSGVGGGIEVVCAELKRDSDRADFAAAEFRHAGRPIAPAALCPRPPASPEDGRIFSLRSVRWLDSMMKRAPSRHGSGARRTRRGRPPPSSSPAASTSRTRSPPRRRKGTTCA